MRLFGLRLVEDPGELTGQHLAFNIHADEARASLGYDTQISDFPEIAIYLARHIIYPLREADLKLINNIRLLIVLLQQQNKRLAYLYPRDVVMCQSLSGAAVAIGLDNRLRPFLLLLSDGLSRG